jgi:hypothetical protein
MGARLKRENQNSKLENQRSLDAPMTGAVTGGK